MNDKMLDIIGLADEAYLREAESQPARQITHRRRFSAGLVAAAAAAAVMTVTAGAVTVAKLIHKESVDYYYNEEMASEMELRGYASGQVTENEHVRMTLENLLVDENYAYGVVTVEYKDETGRQLFREKFVPHSYMLDTDGNYIEYGNDNFISLLGIVKIADRNSDASKEAYMLQLSFNNDPLSHKSRNIPAEVRVVFGDGEQYDPANVHTQQDIPQQGFEGLEFRVNTAPNVRTVSLEADNGYKAVVSEFMFDMHFDLKYAEDGQPVFPDSITLNMKDGTSRTLLSEELAKGTGFSLESVVMSEPAEIRGRFESLINVDELESIDFEGQHFRVK